MLKIAIGLALAALAGCTHTGAVSTVRATNIYSSYDSKINAKITYTVDTTSISKLQKADTVTGFLCAGHRYPVDGSDSFKVSVPAMLEAVFASVHGAEVAQSGTVQLFFRVERFEPRLKFTPKFFSADADATIELGVSVTGTIDGKRIFGTSVDSQRNRSGEAGGFCSGAGQIVADATSDVIKDVLEKIGERLANSQQLRHFSSGASQAPSQTATASQQPPVITTQTFRIISGQYESAVDNVARSAGCGPEGAISLVTDGPKHRYYKVECPKGGALLVRCESEGCRELK